VSNDINIMAKVGPSVAADGSSALARIDKSGALVTHAAHGKYFEAASRGQLFIASQAVGGVAPGTAFSTTPSLAIWNPPGSGVLCAIQQVWVGFVSGTLGAGSLCHGVNPSQVTAPTTGTEIVPQAGLLGTLRSKIRAYTGSTVSVTPVILRASLHMGAGVTTTATFPAAAYDEVDGSIVVPPGSLWAYHGVAAAGTSPLTIMSVVFEEIPIV